MRFISSSSASIFSSNRAFFDFGGSLPRSFERFLNGEFGGFSHGNPNSLFLTDPGFAVLFEKAAQNDAHSIGGMR
jgi:hypothetical protein